MRTYEDTHQDGVSVEAAGSGRRPWRRPWESWSALSEPRRDWLVAGLLLLLSLALHLPLRAQYLNNWDTVNYALGVRDFDITRHQPHPPGYIGYIAVGRMLSYLTQDAHAALTLLSAVAGSVATAALYLLVRRFAAPRYAFVAAALFGTSPLALYYSAVALTYMVGAAVIIPYAWLCHRARRDGSRYCLLGAAVLLAGLGALRQTDMVLLLPLWFYVAWPFPWRERLKGVGIITVLTPLWVVPLIRSIGWDEYVEQSRTLAEYVSSKTALYGWSFNAEAFFYNVRMMSVGFILGSSLALVVVALAAAHRIRPLARLDRDDRRFLCLWAVPALFTFLLLHTGQFGYMLLVLPVFFIWAARALAEVSRVRAERSSSALPAASRRFAVSASYGLLGVFVVVNVAAGFAWFSRGVYALMTTNYHPLLRSVESVLEEDPPTREFDVVANDAHWDRLVDLIHEFGPEQAEVLSYMGGSGTFRHLAYYLPDYHVYGVGYRLGSLGVLFNARDGDGAYMVPWYVDRQDVVVLGPEVDRLIITDLWIANRLPEGIPLTRLTYKGGPSIIVATVPRGAILVFRPPTTERRTHIDVLDRQGRPIILPLGAEPRQAALPLPGLVERRQAVGARLRGSGAAG